MQLPAVFDSYPVATVLNGSGNGMVSFQPNGCTVSVSRLFVQVSTTTKQATVTLYKGGLNASNAIGTIVSGSTGGLASGQIFVTDGQTLYVSWTGGDAGATATATFSGKQVPFSAVGTDSITWSDPIAASDGSLVFPAIKSPNYVAGSTGWTVNRDGSSEFNNVTVRGELDVNGANGSAIQITNSFGTPTIFMLPPNFPGNNPASVGGTIETLGFNSGGSAQCQFVILGPHTTNGNGGTILLTSQSEDHTVGSSLDLLVNKVTIGGNGKDIGRGLLTRVDSISDSAAIAASTEDIVLTLPSVTYKANRAYNAVHNAQASLQTAITNSILYFRLRKNNVGGAIVRPFGRAPLVNTQICAVNQAGEFTVGAADVTATLVLTMSVPAGSTGTHNAGAGFQREVNIYDIGAASDYPNAPVLS